jgi:signal transduction histidine kinase
VSGTVVLLAMSGWVAGTVTARLRSDAVLIARAEAREELARDLHDGVLQTLAVVQRRSDDVELVELARAQEADLRRLISSPVRPGVVSVAGELRSRVPVWRSTFGVDVDVVVIDDGAASPASSVALVAAASEAVVNAAKHSGAERVTVSVDRGELGGTVVVVHDEGRGFDPQRVSGGVGLARSIRDRVAEAGGTVAVRSAPGRGCEVTLWAP